VSLRYEQALKSQQQLWELLTGHYVTAGLQTVPVRDPYYGDVGGSGFRSTLEDTL
jgi:hypothetical protein